MATLDIKDGIFEQDIALNKADLTITLPTTGKYVSKNIKLNVSAQSGSATTPATTINSVPTITINGTGLITATNNTTSNITPVVSPGWVSSGTAGTVTIGGSNTNQLPTAAASVTGTNVVTPTATVSGTNIIYTNQNTGVAITAIGGGSASVTATAATSTAGYAPVSATLGSATLSAESITTTDTKYITGINIPIPESGITEFTVGLPDGMGGYFPLIFTVDSEGNSSVVEGIEEANGVSF